MTVFDWISQEYLPHLADGFIDPRKRVSLLYLFSATAIAVAWSIYMSRGAVRDGLRKLRGTLFSGRIWLSPSARADYKLLLANQALLLLAAPVFVSRAAVATALFFFLHQHFPVGSAMLSGAPPALVAVAYTAFLFLLDDFSRFAVHFALHRVPFLWPFHRIHHSAEVLNPLTVFRTHPVEGVIFTFRAIAVQAVSISLFVFLFGSSIDLVTIYGVGMFLFAFNLAGANLRHSHVQIRYGRRLERLFISPAQHQIHHSRDSRHHDKNFGAALAIWDWMAGSLHTAPGDLKLEFGLARNGDRRTHSLLNLYFSPFAGPIAGIARHATHVHATFRKPKKHAY